MTNTLSLLGHKTIGSYKSPNDREKKTKCPKSALEVRQTEKACVSGHVDRDCGLFSRGYAISNTPLARGPGADFLAFPMKKGFVVDVVKGKKSKGGRKQRDNSE